MKRADDPIILNFEISKRNIRLFQACRQTNLAVEGLKFGFIDFDRRNPKFEIFKLKLELVLAVQKNLLNGSDWLFSNKNKVRLVNKRENEHTWPFFAAIHFSIHQYHSLHTN